MDKGVFAPFTRTGRYVRSDSHKVVASVAIVKLAELDRALRAFGRHVALCRDDLNRYKEWD